MLAWSALPSCALGPCRRISPRAAGSWLGLPEGEDELGGDARLAVGPLAQRAGGDGSDGDRRQAEVDGEHLEVPAGDVLPGSFADVVLDVEDEDAAVSKYTYGFDPGGGVEVPVGLAPLE